jgi:hypothetical protein
MAARSVCFSKHRIADTEPQRHFVLRLAAHRDDRPVWVLTNFDLVFRNAVDHEASQNVFDLVRAFLRGGHSEAV